MATGEPPPESLEQLAASLIGLDDRASSAHRRTALFRKLRDDDFLPDPLAQEAILALGGRPIGPESLLAWQLAEAQAERLHADVERFAAEFFALPVTARVERWNALMTASARDGRRIARLRWLEQGLTIDVQAVVDPSAPESGLVGDILAIFPLPAASQAVESRIRAQRFLNDPAMKETDRERALKLLKRRRPELAALAGSFLHKLTKPRRPSRFNGRPLRSAARGGRPEKPPVSRDSSHVRVLVTLTVVLVSGISRLLTSNQQTRRLEPNPPFNGFTIPQRSPRLTAPYQILLDERKARIRAELDRLGLFLDKPELDQVVAKLPEVGIPSDKNLTRFAESLKEGLRETDLGLTETQLDELVARCLPQSRPQPGPP